MAENDITRRTAIVTAAGGTVALAATMLQAQEKRTDQKPKPIRSAVSGVKYSDESVFILGEGLVASQAFGALRAVVSHEEKLGDVCWMEVRLHLTKPCRDCRAEVWAEFEHPRINDVIDKVRHCLRVAGVAAAVVALIGAVSGAGGAIPSAAVATFKAVLVECLINEGVGFAREISMTVELRNKHCENWTSNCEPCD